MEETKTVAASSRSCHEAWHEFHPIHNKDCLQETRRHESKILTRNSHFQLTCLEVPRLHGKGEGEGDRSHRACLLWSENASICVFKGKACHNDQLALIAEDEDREGMSIEGVGFEPKRIT